MNVPPTLAPRKIASQPPNASATPTHTALHAIARCTAPRAWPLRDAAFAAARPARMSSARSPAIARLNSVQSQNPATGGAL